MKPSLIWTIILLLSAILITGAFYFDAPLRSTIVQAQGGQWKKTTEYQIIAKISRYGDWPQLVLIGALGAGLAWRLRNPNWTKILLAAILASTLAGILANTSRLTTGRTRPRESPKIEQGFYGPWHNGELLIGNSKYNAFPSGHAATAVGFAAVILFAKPLAGLIAMALAFAICWSRIALGAHHLSDVIVSTILGLAVAWFVWQWTERHGTQTATQLLSRLRKLRIGSRRLRTED